MTAKEYLLQVRHIGRRLDAIEREESALRRDIYSLQSIDYTKDRVQSNTKTDLSDLVIKLEHCIKERTAEWDRLIDMREEVVGTIKKVKDHTLSALLIERYIHNRSWEQVAILINCGRSWTISRLHQQALTEIENILKDQTKTNY